MDLLGLVAAAVVGGLVAYFSPYIRRKGENRAALEDTEQLALLAERVKASFQQLQADAQHERALWLERLRGYEGLRLLAGPERLRAHQEAFVQWQALATADPKSAEPGRLAMRWWVKNCLYLDSTARQALLDGIQAFSTRNILLTTPDLPRTKELANQIVEAGDTLRAVGNRILAALGLPPLQSAEIEAVGGIASA